MKRRIDLLELWRYGLTAVSNPTNAIYPGRKTAVFTKSNFALPGKLWRRLFPTVKKDSSELPPSVNTPSSPPVSCICFYTGSPHRLEEAICSFLQQDYDGVKELVIINDDPEVTLQFAHAEVKIVNLPESIRYKRPKWQKAVAACTHNLLMIWGADDISLPHRISITTAKWSSENESYPFIPDTIMIWENERVQGPYHNQFNQGGAWSRRLFERVGGIKGSNYKASIMMPQLKSVDQPPMKSLAPEEIFYLFRGANYATENQTGTVGTIQLQPKWRADYVSAVRDCLATQRFSPIDRTLSPLSGIRTKNLNRYGAIHPRRYYLFVDRELAYISTAKVACTSLKTVMMEPYGIHKRVHNAWPHIYLDALAEEHQGFFTFSFVRNPFDRLVSGYRDKIFAKASDVAFYGDIPTNISFATFVHEVVKRPDCLLNGHFQSQYYKLYQDGKLLVDYLGRFENLDADWQFIANRFRFSTELPHKMKSASKRGVHRNYREYYTEELLHLVYNRFQADFEAFGYQASYEALLAFVREKKG